MGAETSAGTARRLTEYSHGAGCGCKLDPAVLDDVLRTLEPISHPDLLVGTATGDDAAVWRLDGDRALVFTTDFFTPLVDDPRDWGRIAAANAVSDVYAMGGRPLVALNLLAWNQEELGVGVLAQVLDGAASVAREDGFLIVGGHSIDDPEPKYGLAVLGEADPAHLLTNSALQPGDALVLSKPIGVGVVTTAIKAGRAPAELVERAVASMTRTNREAARVAMELGAVAATDVTGFGLLGHLGRMVSVSGVDAVVEAEALPVLAGVRPLVDAGMRPGGTDRNLRWLGERLERESCDDATLALLADPQTSGGLLFGLPPERAREAVRILQESGHDAALVGAASAGTGRLRIC